MPKVSVVMPVYNGEKYLREAIDSILAQSFTDWELIAVNEFGSNEKATEILREYAARDKRICVIQNKKRLFIAESLNVGLRAATGQYIARMDADDIAGPDRLAVQTRFMDQHLDVDICGTSVEMFGDDIWDWKVYSDPEELRCACLFYTPFIHPTVMMRAKSLKRCRLEYDAGFHFTEDFDFFVRASESLKFTNIIQKGLYHYRFLHTNATHIGGDRGIELQNEVMHRVFRRYGLIFTEKEIRMLSPNSYPTAENADEALENLESLDLLLKRVFLCDKLRNRFGEKTLFSVLHRRWLDAYEKNRWQPFMRDKRVQAAVERGLFYQDRLSSAMVGKKQTASPRVSVVMPTYNSEKYVMDTVQSLLNQDYTNFELLVVNELGSDDQTLKCVSLFHDSRIHILQNTQRLGLAESLNRGFREARGEYIARADADDIYLPDRLRKQVTFLDEHPDIAICGTWQRYFGKQDRVHMPPASKESMKAALLFKCDVCHSTVMLRREEFLSRDLLYDSNYLSEDYELWTRASQTLNFATIPEVLGEYRWSGDNITAKKMDMLDEEAQRIVARSLKNILGMELPESDLVLLSGWKNPFWDSAWDTDELKRRENRLLEAIENRNRETRSYDAESLSQVLQERRRWAGIAVQTGDKEETSEEVVRNNPQNASYRTPKRGLKERVLHFLKKLLKPFYRPFRIRYENRIIEIEELLWRQEGALARLQQALYDYDGHLWDYYEQLNHTVADLQTNVVEENVRRFTAALEERLRHSEELMMQVIREDRQMILEESAKWTSSYIDSRLAQSEHVLTQETDARLLKAEELISQVLYERVGKAEQMINQTMDGRVWKAEQLINQTMDGRVWKAEREVKDSLESLQWNVLFEQYVGKTRDSFNLTPHYDFSFYANNRYHSVLSAREVLPDLFQCLPHQSVADFGCGIGSWLWVAQNLGAKDIAGYDGSYVPKSMLMIPDETFYAVDLEKPVKLERKYDLTISMEVAEHLHESAADSFVKMLCKSSDTVLFSAAHPGQGGDGHINEQPKGYWISKFVENGYCAIDISEHFRSNEKIETWYRDNMVLFTAKEKADRVKAAFTDWTHNK